MRYAAAAIAGVMMLSLPAAPRAQGARIQFQDGYAEVNGVRLHYASVGQGPLVLFLHGYPSFWYQWKDQMAEIGRDHRAVGLDMRGYNLSSRPEGVEPYTMTHLVEDVRQFVEKITGRNRKFILVGHDWGANVAWVFAMYHPEMLDKLIIVNGAHPFVSERELRENPPNATPATTFSSSTSIWRRASSPSTSVTRRRAPLAGHTRGSWTRKYEADGTLKTIGRPGSTHGHNPVRRLPVSVTTARIIATRRSTIVTRRRPFRLRGRRRKSRRAPKPQSSKHRRW